MLNLARLDVGPKQSKTVMVRDNCKKIERNNGHLTEVPVRLCFGPICFVFARSQWAEEQPPSKNQA